MSQADGDLEDDLDEEEEDEMEDRDECRALKPLYAAIRADDTDAAITAISDILANPSTTCDMWAAPGTSLFSDHFSWILYGLDESKTALSLACELGRCEVVDLMLEHGAQPNVYHLGEEASRRPGHASAAMVGTLMRRRTTFRTDPYPVVFTPFEPKNRKCSTRTCRSTLRR